MPQDNAEYYHLHGRAATSLPGESRQFNHQLRLPPRRVSSKSRPTCIDRPPDPDMICHTTIPIYVSVQCDCLDVATCAIPDRPSQKPHQGYDYRGEFADGRVPPEMEWPRHWASAARPSATRLAVWRWKVRSVCDKVQAPSSTTPCCRFARAWMRYLTRPCSRLMASPRLPACSNRASMSQAIPSGSRHRRDAGAG